MRTCFDDFLLIIHLFDSQFQSASAKSNDDASQSKKCLDISSKQHGSLFLFWFHKY